MTTHVQDAGHDGSGTSVTVTVTVTAGNTFTLSFDAFVTGNNPVSISSVADNASGGSNTWTYSTAQNNQNPAAAGSFDSTQGQYGFTATAVCLPSANGGTTKTFTTVTITFSTAVAYVGATLSEFSGLAAGSVILTAASTPTAQNGVTSYTTPSLTTSAAALVLTSTCAFNAFTGVTAGYTLQTADTDNNKAYNTSVAAGSVSATFTGTSNRIPASVITAIGPGSATVALTTPNVALAAPLLAPSAGGTVALTAPNLALAAPLLAPTVGKVVALTTPNIALAAPVVALTAGASVALTAPNVALAAPAVTPPATSKSVALTTPNVALSAPLLTPPAVVTPFPLSPLGLQCDLSLAGTWTGVSSYVYQRDGSAPPVKITRGKPDETQTTTPATCTWEWNNRDGRFSPKNPLSPYYGQLTRNTPVRFSVPSHANYLRLEANNSDRAYVNDTTSLHVTGSLELRIGLRLSDWRGCVLAARDDNSLQSWFWTLGADGTMTFGYYDSGGTLRQASTDAPVPFAKSMALRVTLNATNGTLIFYTAPSIDGTYTQLGDAWAMTGGSATSVRAGNAPLVVGWSVNIAGQLLGAVTEFRLYSGIGGTVVAGGVFSAQAAGATTWTGTDGNTWNLAGGAEISSRDYRFHGQMSSQPPRWDVTGNDMAVKAQAGGPLRLISQGKSPVQSPMRRAIAAQSGALAPVAYWPMEDGAGATQFGQAIGQFPMTWGSPPNPAADSSFICSAPLPTLNNAAPQGLVASYAGTGTWTVRFLASIPTLPASGEQVLFQVDCANGIAAYVIMVVTSAGTVRLTASDAAGNIVANTGYFSWAGLQTPLWWSIEAQPSGSDVQYSLVSLAPGSSVGLDISATTSSAGTAGSVTLAAPSPFGTWSDTVIGHVQVQSAWVSLFSLAGPLDAWIGELAAVRYGRLATENGWQARIIGSPAYSAAMGAQGIDTLQNLLQECETADMGQQLEPRQCLGLGYRTLASMTSQSPVLTADYAASAPGGVNGDGTDSGLDPAYDDLLSRNDWAVTRGSSTGSQGSTVRVQLNDGSLMSTTGMGDYDDTQTVNVAADSQLSDVASWMVHLGTVDEYRWPLIPVNLARPAMSALYFAALDLDVGDLLVMPNAPDMVLFDPVRQLMLGTTESLGGKHYTLEFNSVPASPYDVARYDDAVYGRADTDGSTLHTSVNATATSLSVTTASGFPLWTTTAADVPFDIAMSGERMTVTNITGSSSPQTFTVTRSVNGVSKSQTAGADVRLWFTPVYAIG